MAHYAQRGWSLAYCLAHCAFCRFLVGAELAGDRAAPAVDDHAERQ
jgi:hypothetical protein